MLLTSDLHHGPDQERRDQGEDDAGDQLEEEAVEQDVEAVQLNIGHLQHTIYSFIMPCYIGFLKRRPQIEGAFSKYLDESLNENHGPGVSRR